MQLEIPLDTYAARIKPPGMAHLEVFSIRYADRAPRLAAWLASVVQDEDERRQADPPIEAMPLAIDVSDWTDDDIADALPVSAIICVAMHGDSTQVLTRRLHGAIMTTAAMRLRKHVQ